MRGKMAETFISMTLNDLRKYCKDHGIKGYSGLTKKDTIRLLNGEPLRDKIRAVPKKVKTELWRKYFSGYEGECFVCSRTVFNDSFEAGHIISRNDGGLCELDNLKVICLPCNRSMGTMNIYEFKEMILTEEAAKDLLIKSLNKITNKNFREYVIRLAIFIKKNDKITKNELSTHLDLFTAYNSAFKERFKQTFYLGNYLEASGVFEVENLDKKTMIKMAHFLNDL